jgi:hypothetical protein
MKSSVTCKAPVPWCAALRCTGHAAEDCLKRGDYTTGAAIEVCEALSYDLPIVRPTKFELGFRRPFLRERAVTATTKRLTGRGSGSRRRTRQGRIPQFGSHRGRAR